MAAPERGHGTICQSHFLHRLHYRGISSAAFGVPYSALPLFVQFFVKNLPHCPFAIIFSFSLVQVLLSFFQNLFIYHLFHWRLSLAFSTHNRKEPLGTSTDSFFFSTYFIRYEKSRFILLLLFVKISFMPIVIQ